MSPFPFPVYSPNPEPLIAKPEGIKWPFRPPINPTFLDNEEVTLRVIADMKNTYKEMYLATSSPMEIQRATSINIGPDKQLRLNWSTARKHSKYLFSLVSGYVIH